MRKLILVSLLLALVFTLFQCGGPKKLSPEEYQNLSPQERVTYLEAYTQKNPEDIQAKKDLYREYLEMDMPEKAIPVMKQIITQDPYQADVQYDYGVLMMKRGESQIAYRAFREALQSPSGNTYAGDISQYLGGKYLIQQVTSGETDEAFPAFSHDGQRIVYQIYRNGNWDIAEMTLADKSVKFLVTGPADEELPSFSPDDRHLVYTSNADDKRPIDNKFKVREIYKKNLTNDITENLTETVADDWLPRYSHDGNQILFVSERSDLRSVPYTEKKSDIYVMDNKGDFHTQLTDGESNNGGPCFTPDDQHIFFHSNRYDSYDIFMMKADGTTPITVLGNPDANEVNPFVAPDSQHLVYFSDQGNNYDIYQAKTDGSEITRLTFNPARDTNPVYSPDGKSIAFHSDRNGNFDIFIISLEVTSEPTVQELISRLDKMIQ